MGTEKRVACQTGGMRDNQMRRVESMVAEDGSGLTGRDMGFGWSKAVTESIGDDEG